MGRRQTPFQVQPVRGRLVKVVAYVTKPMTFGDEMMATSSRLDQFFLLTAKRRASALILA